MAGSALVLGGGGVTGVAWELGLLHGLHEAGLDLTGADTIIGTSAGSVVAAQIATGGDLGQLYDRQVAGFGTEVSARIGLTTILRMVLASAGRRDEQRSRARVGAIALSARTISGADRRAVIAGRVGDHEWPRRRLLITAVAADTGEFVVFDRESGVSLVDAVAASCAVPGVWPPVTINDRRYIDGGVRSPVNADLARGADRVVVLAPIITALRRSHGAKAQIAALATAARTVLVFPDQAARTAIGRNVLDPARRAPAAQAGLRQARDVLDALTDAWAP